MVTSSAETGGFEVSEIIQAIRDAGFGIGEMRIQARGTLMEHEDSLALSLPDSPHRLILVAGEELEKLKASGEQIGSSLWVEGKVYPSKDSKPDGMQLHEWQRLERPESYRADS